MENKYSYQVNWSEEDGVYIANCAEFPGAQAHGESAEAAIGAMKDVVSIMLKALKDEKEEAPEPIGKKQYNGRILVRVSPDIHRELERKSAYDKTSINQTLLTFISRGLAGPEYDKERIVRKQDRETRKPRTEHESRSSGLSKKGRTGVRK